MKYFLKQREQTKPNCISPSAAPVTPHLLLQSLSTVVQQQCHIHNGPIKSHPNGRSSTTTIELVLCQGVKNCYRSYKALTK